jgi:hypothetical protein
VGIPGGQKHPASMASMANGLQPYESNSLVCCRTSRWVPASMANDRPESGKSGKSVLGRDTLEPVPFRPFRPVARCHRAVGPRSHHSARSFPHPWPFPTLTPFASVSKPLRHKALSLATGRGRQKGFRMPLRDAPADVQHCTKGLKRLGLQETKCKQILNQHCVMHKSSA